MQVVKNLTLAIETAVGGGSLSIFKGQTLIDFWIGNAEISKAEDVLENISYLFERNHITKENIEKIVVSGDVGSTTGLKIGMATGQGLAKSFASRLTVASLIESLTTAVSVDEIQQYMIALPVGKGNVFCLELINEQRVNNGLVVKTENFFNMISNNEHHIYAHQKIYDLKLTFDIGISVLDTIGNNMASHLINNKRV